MAAAPAREDGRLTVALISEVFWEPDGRGRLRDRLAEAADRGADIAVLPEIPLNSWSPATRDQREDDAEPMGGPRMNTQQEAAAEAGIGLVGGIIHRDAETGRRTQRTLVFDRAGELVATYEKLHLPDEPGFWEPRPLRPGHGSATPDRCIRPADRRAGLLRHESPAGHAAACCPGRSGRADPGRSSEEKTYQRWKFVFRANALTNACYVLSVNRPAPEQGVLIGGPSIAVDPGANVILETTDTLGMVTLDAETIRKAKVAYPGYLPTRAALYADAWDEIATRDGEGPTPSA